MGLWKVTYDSSGAGVTATNDQGETKWFDSDNPTSPFLGSKWFVPAYPSEPRLYYLAWYIGRSLQDPLKLHYFALLPPSQMENASNNGYNILQFVATQELYRCRHINDDGYTALDHLHNVHKMVYDAERNALMIHANGDLAYSEHIEKAFNEYANNPRPRLRRSTHFFKHETPDEEERLYDHQRRVLEDRFGIASNQARGYGW